MLRAQRPSPAAHDRPASAWGQQPEDAATENQLALDEAGLGASGVGGLSGFAEMIDEALLAAELASIPTRDIVYEQLAHHLAYLDGGCAEHPLELADLGYVEVGRIDDPSTGLQAVAFAPVAAPLLREQGLPEPDVGVMAFRGTEPDDLGDLGDDFNPAGVGYAQFEANHDQIAALMGSLGACDVVGHSLGGALAQLAACRIGGVRSVVTFQAPGIAEEDVALLDASAACTHYRLEGDVVDNAGEAHTRGEVVELESTGVDGPEGHTDILLVQAGEGRGIEGLQGTGLGIEGMARTTTDRDDQRYEDIRRETGECARDVAEIREAVREALEQGITDAGLGPLIAALGLDLSALAEELAEQIVALGEQLLSDPASLEQQIGRILVGCGLPQAPARVAAAFVTDALVAALG